MKNENVRSTVRQSQFPAAIKALSDLGLKAVIANGAEPRGQREILGLTSGWTQIDLAGANSELALGAIVDNLTSHGGFLRRLPGPNPQTRISAFLRAGAAGASGTVIEPLAVPQKFPTAWLHVHYARGACLAEAFYLSVEAPFQLLILGDPLCQPWASIPEVTVDGIADGDTISGTVQITPSAQVAEGRAISRFDVYIDGKKSRERTPGQKAGIDTTKLPDGNHELRVVAIDNSPLETQGRWIGNVIVKNGREAVSISSVTGPRVSGPTVSLTVSCTIDATTLVIHNGREVGRAIGRRATLQIPVEKLGKGPVVLEGRTIGQTRLRSQPLALEIQ